MESQGVILSLLKLLFTEDITNHFEISGVKEQKSHIEIRMEELRELVPPDMPQTGPVVLDGFCNPLELQSFPIKGKPVYLKLYRRRWKLQGSDKHYSNKYTIQPEGVKATKEFASFLKESFGYTTDQYNDNIRVLMR